MGHEGYSTRNVGVGSPSDLIRDEKVVVLTRVMTMGCVDNCDPPPAILQQAFCHSAGLAVNLLEAVDNGSHCHQMLAKKVETMAKQQTTLRELMKRELAQGSTKVLPFLPLSF
jgi:hypothetical protein